LDATPSTPNVHIRRALPEDAPDLRLLIDASIRKLGGKFYTPEQVESSLAHVFGVDSTMIADGTYFVVVAGSDIIGAGGWSFRLTPFGGDQEHTVRDASVRVPGKDPAVIRAMYVHPDWARRKIGHLIITTCEHAARAAGFQAYELVATLSGVTFYKNQGYHQVEEIAHRLPDGVLIDFVRMAKTS
jgi:GNAT superfamily N-acetyltransferase